MTDQEKAIIMAHTGICMLTGEKFGVFHAYIEDIMGRPVYTHELAVQSICDEIKEKSRDDFIKLCMEEQETCEDAISRKSIKQKLQEHHDFFVNAYGGFSNLPLNDKSRVDEITNCIAMVVNEPPVTPQPKTGRWIAYEVRLPDRTILNYRCSVCGRKLIGYNTETLNEAPFCHCGARMQEAEDE